MPIPKIQVALNGWESSITLIKVTQSIVDYETVNTEEEISFQGVVQPLTAEALQLKPLETRSWEWLMIHTRTSAEIFTNDLIRYDGKEYKVMFEKNYSLNGYYEYHLVKDYE
jgi:hypothetical protein